MAVHELLMNEPTCRIEPGDSPGVWVRKLSDGSGGSPQALVATGPGQRKTEAHFHDVAQFQVVLEGKLTFVGHPLEAIAVHYTDAHTPYGFFVADSQAKFATLRPRKGGIVWMYDAEKRNLRDPHGRELTGQSGEASWEAVSGMAGMRRKVLIGKDSEPGPRAQIWQCPADAVIEPRSAPFGEYQILLEGSSWSGPEQVTPYSMRFVVGDEPPSPFKAGPQGATWLLLTFDQAANG